MILTENGVLKLMQRIKSFITSQLNTKANSVHTHTISEIDDLSSLQMGGGYTKSEVDTLLNDYIPKSGGGVFSGTQYKHINNNQYIELYSTSDRSQGGSLGIYSLSVDFEPLRGAFRLQSRDGTNVYTLGGSRDGILEWSGVEIRAATDNKCKLGDSYHRWSTVYSATSSINTSDSRLKNTISSIDDSLLDAWETIQHKQYKFNDATETKGEQARFHTGYIAQDIEKACNDNNIDATRYGLFCYDSWEEEPEITEDVEVENDGVKTTEKRIIRPKREKGDAYSLRYEEALVVECAYLRREISRLKEELNLLKAK